jgi:hypothetical protein
MLVGGLLPAPHADYDLLLSVSSACIAPGAPAPGRLSFADWAIIAVAVAGCFVAGISRLRVLAEAHHVAKPTGAGNLAGPAPLVRSALIAADGPAEQAARGVQPLRQFLRNIRPQLRHAGRHGAAPLRAFIAWYTRERDAEPPTRP